LGLDLLKHLYIFFNNLNVVSSKAVGLLYCVILLGVGLGGGFRKGGYTPKGCSNLVVNDRLSWFERCALIRGFLGNGSCIACIV
jgi:hypothetical protein